MAVKNRAPILGGNYISTENDPLYKCADDNSYDILIHITNNCAHNNQSGHPLFGLINHMVQAILLCGEVCFLLVIAHSPT